jgi:hypothetical protein
LVSGFFLYFFIFGFIFFIEKFIWIFAKMSLLLNLISGSTCRNNTNSVNNFFNKLAAYFLLVVICFVMGSIHPSIMGTRGNYDVQHMSAKITGRDRPGCQLCQKSFTTACTVDPSFHKKAKYLSKKYTNEFAGNLEKDKTTHTLTGTNVFTGNTYLVKMEDHGVVDWHTHPTKCLDKTEYAIGLPSSMDLKNILFFYIYKGVQGHLIYSRDGVYAIQISDELAKRLCGLEDEKINEFIDKRVYDHLKKVHSDYEKEFIYFWPPNDFLDEKEALKIYCQYKSKFMQEAKKLGFVISLHKNNEGPPQLNLKSEKLN